MGTQTMFAHEPAGNGQGNLFCDYLNINWRLLERY
jgi:hypothetical protein